MGGREKRENAQRKKCLETDISTTLQAFDASKHKDCDPWILNSLKLSLTSQEGFIKIQQVYHFCEILTVRSISTET